MEPLICLSFANRGLRAVGRDFSCILTYPRCRDILLILAHITR